MVSSPFRRAWFRPVLSARNVSSLHGFFLAFDCLARQAGHPYRRFCPRMPRLITGATIFFKINFLFFFQLNIGESSN